MGRPGGRRGIRQMAIWYGTANADVLVGTAEGDTISADGGNDQVSGQGGNDSLAGDAGDDVIDGGAGNDSLYGGTGDDVLDGGVRQRRSLRRRRLGRLDGGDGDDRRRVRGAGRGRPFRHPHRRRRQRFDECGLWRLDVAAETGTDTLNRGHGAAAGLTADFARERHRDGRRSSRSNGLRTDATPFDDKVLAGGIPGSTWLEMSGWGGDDEITGDDGRSTTSGAATATSDIRETAGAIPATPLRATGFGARPGNDIIHMGDDGARGHGGHRRR